MRPLALALLLAGCATTISSRVADPSRPEWVDVHERAFYEPDGEVILVYGVGSLRADSELCRPDLVRPVVEGRALPPMQHLLGAGETVIPDTVATSGRNGHEWHHTNTTRERRASGSLFMVTTQGAWFDPANRELYILERAIASVRGLDLLPPRGIDTSSPQTFEEALRAYLAACVPPPPPPPVPVHEHAVALDHAPCTGHCRHAEKPVVTTCAERCRTEGPSRLCSCRELSPAP